MNRSRVAVLFACLASLLAPKSLAEDFFDGHVSSSTTIWRVEEKWEVTVSNPEPSVSAPHITTTFSPTGHGEGQHAIVNINHVTLDYFQPGGVQIQVWDGETPITHKRVPWQSVIEDPNEVISWTQSMTHLGDQIIYQITDGQSTTWGNFGGQGFLTATVSATTPNLNAYDPNYSLENSGPVYASNRVASLKLKSIVVHTLDGDRIEIPVNAEVHSSTD